MRAARASPTTVTLSGAFAARASGDRVRIGRFDREQQAMKRASAASSSRERGPKIAKPPRASLEFSTRTSAARRCASNQRPCLGLVALIARGYRILAALFIAVYVLPLLVRCVRSIRGIRRPATGLP